MDKRHATYSRGISLFELIIVIIILGILTVIIVPLFPKMTESSKQSNTVANLRSIASAMSIYYADNNGYPIASNVLEIKAVLEPDYMLPMPTRDGWGNDFLAESTNETYIIGSGGRGWDGNEPLTETPAGPTHSLESDIILKDGAFIQYPVGYAAE